MDYTIDIDLARVLDEVALMTGYIEAVALAPEGKPFDRIATLPEDSPLLEGFTKEAEGLLRTALSEYLRQDRSEPGRLLLHLPDNADRQALESASENVRAFTVDHTLSRWLAVTCKAEAAEAEKRAAETLALIIGCMHKRRRPERPTSSH